MGPPRKRRSARFTIDGFRCCTRGEDTRRNLKHLKDRAANLTERPQGVSSVTRITSTLRACANARTFLRSGALLLLPYTTKGTIRHPVIWPISRHWAGSTSI